MQRHLNLQRAFLSIENRTSQVELASRCPSGIFLRDRQQRRIHTTSQRLASCISNTELRAPSATTHGPSTGSLQRNRLGSVAQYSTAQTQPNLIPDNVDQIHGEGAAQGGSLEADNTQSNGAIPGENDYGGLGKLLLNSPLGTLTHLFVRKNFMRLDSRFESSHAETVCTIECKIYHSKNSIIARATAKNKKDANHRAAVSLVSQLHVTGMLQDLIDLKNGLQPSLVMEGDLVITMREALRDLIRAGQFPMPERHRPQPRLPADEGSAAAGERKKAHLRKRSDLLLHRQRNRSEAGVQIRAASLPIAARKDQVLQIVMNNTYSIIVAETGAGKSTQLPQFLLDHAIAQGRGAECRVICVQPRRIATVSLAQRVAKERDEQFGETVGYQIRFDNRADQKGGSITYCTTGILLQQLKNSPSLLDSVSYILLDEVHERKLELDLLMLLLKRYMEERQAKGKSVPKVVIMSATLDVDLFASYFQNKLSDGQLSPAPHLHIPGRSFAVEKYYLEDFLASLPRVYPLQKTSWLLQESNTTAYLKNILPPKTKSASQWMPALSEEEHIVPYGLICLAINYILSTTDEGAILVFLPGLRHLLDVENMLQESRNMLGNDFSDKTRFNILKLHSSIPEAQVEIFSKVQPSCRQIILATNIAETSVTIPDVNFVVDSGKVHQMIFDPRSRFTGLSCCWTSQSSISQRSGRAGRLRDGGYFGLFPRSVQDQLRVNNSPDMQRTDLQTTCLNVKKAVPNASIQGLLQESIEPPDVAQIQQAVLSLQALQALDEKEDITTLGNILSDFPLDPCRGKLVLLGIVFRCLDPLLIIASLGRDLSLFHMGLVDDARKEQNRTRTAYSENTWSDHISLINAFKDMRDVWSRSKESAARAHAYARHIHYPRFREGLDVARQLLVVLGERGLIPQQKASRHPSYQYGGPGLNVNSWHIPLIKALILHTMYPNLATAHPGKSSGYTAEHENNLTIGPGSVNKRWTPRCLLTFNQKRRTPMGSLVLQDNTHVTPLVACLFGGRLQGSMNTLRMDGWLEFTIQVRKEAMDSAYATRILIEFRKSLEMAIMASFSVIANSTKQDHREPYNISTVSREFVLDAISKNLVQVLDQDYDPIYAARDRPTKEW